MLQCQVSKRSDFEVGNRPLEIMAVGALYDAGGWGQREAYAEKKSAHSKETLKRKREWIRSVLMPIYRQRRDRRDTVELLIAAAFTCPLTKRGAF